MAYQVLARKWRPSNFTQLVGQEHVALSLIHALQHNRLHHAYLFTGTRGVGKTTVARILAKAINCENLQDDANPCGLCSVCLAFEQGRFMDLIEVDAASRTKVEDTRELLDNTQYAPHQGRYKVYLIDEVHMLSNHSFNALLKTLEEPPEHVKFLLATTDPHKIPVTVLSRCLQFNLKRLQPEQIMQQMQFILTQEGISSEAAALKLIARAADGSMRDSLSLLDQAIVYGAGEVNLATVTNMLGVVAQQPVIEIMQALIKADINVVLRKTADIAELSADFSDILQQMLRVLHRVALLQQAPNFDDQEYDRQFLTEIATALLPEDVQLYYQIGLIGQRDLPLAPDSRSGFEMVLLRMLSFKPNSMPVLVHAPAATKPVSVSGDISSVASAAPVITSANVPARVQPTNLDWSSIIATLRLVGMTKELASHCVLDSLDEHGCRLLLNPNYQQIGDKAEEKLKEALENYFGRSIKLTIAKQSTTQLTPAETQKKAEADRLSAAVDDINSDVNVQNLMNNFSARILPGSIEPLS